MLTQWRSRNASQVKRITKAIEHNLELQMLVHERSQLLASQKGSSIAEMTKRQTKERIDDDKELDISEPMKQLGKARLAYKTWPKLWLQEIACSMTGCPFKAITGIKDKLRLLMMIEYATGLQIAGDMDIEKMKNPKMTKQDAFDRVVALYHMKGDRLARVMDDIQEDGCIDWAKVGHFELQAGVGASGKAIVKITCKTLRRSATIDEDTIADDMGPFGLKMNLSLAKAVVKSPKETCSAEPLPSVV